jgi:hypothetical protein
MISRLTTYVRRHHVGLLALAVALTGTAYAANKIGPNQIKPNAVRGYHVKKGHIGGNNLGELTIVRRNSAPGSPSVTAFCPKNHRLISGGASSGGEITSSQPIHGIRGGWAAQANVLGVQAIAVCLKRTPSSKARLTR